MCTDIYVQVLRQRKQITDVEKYNYYYYYYYYYYY